MIELSCEYLSGRCIWLYVSDMVKYELKVTRCELRVMIYELKA